jgi:hypothetical protein
MKDAKFLFQDNFYAGPYIWNIVDDGISISLTPLFNRKIPIREFITLIVLSMFAAFCFKILAINLNIIGFHYRIMMLIPFVMFFMGIILIPIKTMLDNKDIKLGSTFCFDRKTKQITLPRYNIKIENNDAIYLQLITGQHVEHNMIYELNLVINDKKRLPLLRALHPFVCERSIKLSQLTGIRLKEYKSSGKSSYYQPITGGRS